MIAKQGSASVQSEAQMHEPRRYRSAAFAGLLFACTACTPPDPEAFLEIVDLEAYWVVDSTSGGRVYLAPAVRLELRNRSDEVCPSIQGVAVFRRAGEEETWGNDWQQITRAGESLEPGETILVLMKSDGRYHSNTNPDNFFDHELFKDARVNIFFRVGSSKLVLFAEADVERRVGSKTVVLGEAPDPSEPSQAPEP
jgi:hypothetical protein